MQLVESITWGLENNLGAILSPCPVTQKKLFMTTGQNAIFGTQSALAPDEPRERRSAPGLLNRRFAMLNLLCACRRSPKKKTGSATYNFFFRTKASACGGCLCNHILPLMLALAIALAQVLPLPTPNQPAGLLKHPCAMNNSHAFMHVGLHSTASSLHARLAIDLSHGLHMRASGSRIESHGSGIESHGDQVRATALELRAMAIK